MEQDTFMSWREFFASVIDALAWPLLVGAVVYVFREPLRDRIRYLRRARLPGLGLRSPRLPEPPLSKRGSPSSAS